MIEVIIVILPLKVAIPRLGLQVQDAGLNGFRLSLGELPCSQVSRMFLLDLLDSDTLATMFFCCVWSDGICQGCRPEVLNPNNSNVPSGLVQPMAYDLEELRVLKEHRV